MAKLTDFEKKVLEKIRDIPRGRVSTYAEVARAIGYPGAARAVGNALNKNPNAPKVPCHRIVKSGGGLGGYAEGKEVKVKLLRKEGIAVKKEKLRNFEIKMYKFK